MNFCSFVAFCFGSQSKQNWAGVLVCLGGDDLFENQGRYLANTGITYQ